MDQALDEQNVFARDFDLMTEEDFLDFIRAAGFAGPVARFYKAAHNGDVHGSHQIGHEHESVLEYCKQSDSAAFIVVGNLAPHVFDAILNLLCSNDGANLVSLRANRHEVDAPPALSTTYND